MWKKKQEKLPEPAIKQITQEDRLEQELRVKRVQLGIQKLLQEEHCTLQVEAILRESGISFNIIIVPLLVEENTDANQQHKN